MKLKRNCFNIILVIILCLTLSLNIPVNADTWEWKEIRTLYENNTESSMIEIIKGLTEDEIDQWKNEIASVEKLYNEAENKQTIIDALYDWFGVETNTWDDDKKIAGDIEKWIDEVVEAEDKKDEPKPSEEELEDKEEKFKNKSASDVFKWLDNYSIGALSTVEGFDEQAIKNIKEAWYTTLDEYYKLYPNSRSRAYYIGLLEGMSEKEAQEAADEAGKEAAGNDANTPAGPSTGLIGESNASSDHTADEIINNANNFIDVGKNEGSRIDTDNLQTASNTLYNILLSIGVVIAVAVGMYLGVKFMMSSAEDKAKVKESLIPYIAGCVVIFGAFIIWKLAILLLNGLS